MKYYLSQSFVKYIYKLSFIIILLNKFTMAQSIQYTLSFPEPHTHYVNVKMEIKSMPKKDYLEIKMPVWAPGSYLVREFSKNIDSVKAYSENAIFKVEKTRKNIWKIACANEANVTIEYQVYCFELSVRTSYITDEYAFISPPSVFMYVDEWKNNNYTVKINTYEKWKQISCSLKTDKEKYSLHADNFDALIDAPILIGNQKIFEVKAANITHYIAMNGVHKVPETFTADIKKILEAANSIIGENPCENYTVIVLHAPDASGGLEHTNSTALLWRPFSYFGKDYKNFLSLLAHEYFHLWNVKRIRPVALGPFDYDNENYTTSLWISEGFTQNYDDYITHRAGIYTAQEYLDILADNISKYESNTGKEVQTVAESSFDAWIKYYRRNENTNNTQISYYDKGAFVALMLNLMIMNESNGEKSLNNVMKDLWENYKYNTNRGFTENEIQQILQKYTNEPMQAFLSNYVFGKKDLDYEKYLNYVGLTLIDKSIKEVKLGAKWNDKFIITETPRNTPAYISGLNVNDEIIAINNIRIKNNNDIETAIKITERNAVEVLINRNGLIKTILVELFAFEQRKIYQIKVKENITQKQENILHSWLIWQ